MNAGASAEQVSVVTAVASSSVSSEKSLETAGLLQELDWIDSDAMITAFANFHVMHFEEVSAS